MMLKNAKGECDMKIINKLSILMAATAAMMAAGAEFRISPDGDDTGDGSKAKPVKTLQRAVELARALEREEEKVIVFEDGFYPFEKPVRFVASDYDFTIKAEHPGKAILSGSVKLTGWRQDENDPRLLVADLPFEPEEGALYTLASGSEWCGLASFPEKGRLRYKSAGENNHTYLQYDMKSLPEGVNLSGLDLKSAWLIIPQEWATTRTGIATNDVANGAFILKSKTNMPIGQYNQGFTLMNTRHGVRKPGMWMYEATAKKVVYWPREGETADNLDCEISRAMAIFDVHNTKNMKVSGLVMQGCAMSFANNNIYSAGPANAVFSMKGAYRLEVDNVVIRNTAGGGIAALKPVKCVTRNSHVYNVGGTAIDYIDGGDASDVINCHVHDYGRLNSAACGVGLQISNVKCIGNHIHDGPGNGVVLWSDNSIFASNHLHHVMQVQRDGGGLYGGYNNTLVKDNYVHDIGGWPGLYADEGSQNSVFCGNTFENCWWPTHMHQTQFITVSNNVMKCDRPMRFSFQGSGHGRFCDNKIYTTKPITNDPYLANCDFWGHNEVFVKQEDGSYKSTGLVTLERVKPKPGTMEIYSLCGKPELPISATEPADAGELRLAALCGKLEPPISATDEMSFRAFGIPWNKRGYVGVGEDGYPNPGVPFSSVQIAYDDRYLYVGFERKYNALCGYPAMQNFTSRGWRHCDANRVEFEGGRRITTYPDGTFETNDKGNFKMTKDDVKFRGGGACIMRIPLDTLNINGAKPKEPGKLDVIGCEIKFNAMIWVEDLRELKALYGPDGKNYATGTLKFLGPNSK